MSNGHFNCLVGACCPPEQQAKATARKLAAWSGGKYSSEELLEMATAIVKDPDLAFVPKPVAQAILATYPALLAAGSET